MAVTPEVRAAAGKELSRRLIVEDRALGAAISAKGPIAVYLASKEEIDLTDFIAAALSDAPTRVTYSRSDAFGADVRATIGCLSALGASILQEEGAFLVRPCSPLGAVALDCGESGSTLRFLLPVAAALTDGYTITGHGRLPERSKGCSMRLPPMAARCTAKCRRAGGIRSCRLW